jgi:hypothetical protein
VVEEEEDIQEEIAAVEVVGEVILIEVVEVIEVEEVEVVVDMTVFQAVVLLRKNLLFMIYANFMFEMVAVDSAIRVGTVIQL